MSIPTDTDVRAGKQLRVAIVGGGVCGLTCALALAREGIHAEVFEAAPKFGEIGAGVGFSSNAVRVLKDIGILDDLLANCGEHDVGLSSFVFYNGTGSGSYVYEYPMEPEDMGIGVHRATFLDTLVKSLNTKYTNHDKRCVGVTHAEGTGPGSPIIHFEDGTTYEADVVLGADGVKSAVRRAVVGEDAPQPTVAYGNTYCYRGLVPTNKLVSAGVKTELTKRPVCFLGKDKHIITFPIKSASFINVVALVTDRSVPIGSIERPPDEPWVVPVSQGEMMTEYEGFSSDVLSLLGCIQNPSKWMIRIVRPLKSYVQGRVALLGDAAHAMLPHLGAGAGQSLEDAYVLAKLLGHPETNLENVELVLQAYDHARRKHAQMVWDGSVAAGGTYAGHGMHGFTTQGLLQDLPAQWETQKAVWRHSLTADYEEAIAYLQAQGAFRSASLNCPPLKTDPTAPPRAVGVAEWIRQACLPF